MSHFFARASLVLVLVFSHSSAHADSSREFLLSCTYGVLAGSLVGAATLAVEENPGDKIHRVARGASLGLYAGILLGLYVGYIVPSQMERQQKKQLNDTAPIEPDDYGSLESFAPPRLTFYPVLENNQITGAALQYNMLRF